MTREHAKPPKWLDLLPALLLTALAIGCDNGDPLLFPEVELSEIRIHPAEAVLLTGTATDFSVVLFDMHDREVPPGPETPTVKWSTGNPNIAEANESGRVEGSSGGFTQVIATAGGLLAEATVIVQPATEDVDFQGGDLEFEGIAGLPLEDDVAVRVQNSAGEGVPGVTVRFSPRAGSGSVDPALVTTDSQGMARTSWTLGRRAGVHEVTASIPLPDPEDGLSPSDGDPDVAANRPERENPQQRLRGWARPGKPKEVHVTPSAESAPEGDSVQFQAEVRDQHGNLIPDAELTWSTTDSEVASVDSEGLARAQSSGVSIIEAEVDGVEGSGTLTVGDGDGTDPGPAASLTISPANWTLAGVGDTLRLDAVAKDSDGRTVSDITLEWSSEHPEIATVSQEGLVTAKGIGTAAILAAVVCTTSNCEGVTDVSQGEVEEVETASDPGQVTDLAATGSTTNSVTVSFTEVDDGTGDPANYALRYGSPTISWGSAQPTEVAIEGSEIGNKREYHYNGLEPGAEYEFRLVAYRGTLNAGATFGELSNVAPASTEAVEPGEPTSVTLTPGSATIWGIGNTRQFTAEVKDADGNPISDPSIEWSTSDPQIVTVTQEGLVEAMDLGTALVVAAAMCGNVACAEAESPVSVQTYEPSDRYPNQPAGYEPWFEHDWQTFSTIRDEWPLAASGAGWFNTAGWSGGSGSSEPHPRMEYVDDPDAPHGFGKSIRITAPEGHPSGSSYATWTFAVVPNTPSNADLEDGFADNYFSFWLYLEPNPEDGLYQQFGIQRLTSFNRTIATSDCSPNTDGGLSLRGGAEYNSADNPMGEWWMRWPYECGGGNTSPTGDRIRATPGPSVGSWYHIERLWERTQGGMTPGNEEGETRLRMWVNGELRLDYTGPHKWESPIVEVRINLNPSAGSSENTRDRTEHFRLAGFYGSGIPFKDWAP